MSHVTAIFAASRACRHLRAKDPSIMAPEDAEELTGAINSALFQYFEKAPTIYKRTAGTELLLAPVTRTFTIAAGANAITSGAFLESERGKAIRLGDDPTLNEIISTTQLLRPHRGSSGSQSGIIYSDAVSFRNLAIENLVSAPRIADTRTELIEVERIGSSFRGAIVPAAISRTIGQPRHYCVDYVGGSRPGTAQDAVFIVRIDPIPGVEMTIEFDFLVRSSAITLQDLNETTLIPIDDAVFDAQFLPLVEKELLSSTLWAGNAVATAAVPTRAAEALASIGRLPKTFKRPRNRIGTRRGF